MKNILFLCLSAMFMSAGMSAQPVNWANDIAPILYKNCTTCHHEGGLAPTTLMQFQDAYDNRYGIREQVENKIMPPWPPDPAYSQLAHPRILSNDDISKILSWVDNNAPSGDLAAAPAPPVYNNEETITDPDLVITIPPYTSTASTQDVYRCFPLPSGLSVDQFITAFECIPGNSAIVHHVLIYQDISNNCYNLDAADPGPGYTNFGGVGSNTAKLIGTWVPGSRPAFWPNGMGVKIKANANIILQIHYPKGTAGQMDSTHVNIKLTTSTLREISISPLLNHVVSITNGPLYIPANTTRTFYSKYSVPIAASLIGIGPHMHLIGKKIKSFGVTLQNDTIPLINIENWDFHWQGQYDFAKIKKIPFGTQLFGEAFYDNTSNNDENPNDPPQDVSVGESTTDEMMLIYFAYTGYQPGDENIVLDSSLFTGVREPVAEKVALQCQPNPVQDDLDITFTMPAAEVGDISIYNAEGLLVKKVKTKDHFVKGENRVHVKVNDLAIGQYFVQFRSEKWYGVSKMIKM